MSSHSSSNHPGWRSLITCLAVGAALHLAHSSFALADGGHGGGGEHGGEHGGDHGGGHGGGGGWDHGGDHGDHGGGGGWDHGGPGHDYPPPHPGPGYPPPPPPNYPPYNPPPSYEGSTITRTIDYRYYGQVYLSLNDIFGLQYYAGRQIQQIFITGSSDDGFSTVELAINGYPTGQRMNFGTWINEYSYWPNAYSNVLGRDINTIGFMINNNGNGTTGINSITIRFTQ